MWIEDAMLEGQTGPASKPGRGADEITEAVDGAQSGVLERTCKKAARQVRGMMLDVVHARRHGRFLEPDRIGARAGDVADRHHVRGAIADQRQVRTMAQREQPFSPQVRLRVARHRERIDVARLCARHRETRTDRLAWKPRVMLDPAESLFLDGGNELAIAQNDCGDVTVVCVDADYQHGQVARRRKTVSDPAVSIASKRESVSTTSVVKRTLSRSGRPARERLS